MKRYPCIGGPLAGKMLTSKDFEVHFVARTGADGKIRFVADPLTSGRYSEYDDQYENYNRANGYSKSPSMVRIHVSLL